MVSSIINLLNRHISVLLLACQPGTINNECTISIEKYLCKHKDKLIKYVLDEMKQFDFKCIDISFKEDDYFGEIKYQWTVPTDKKSIYYKLEKHYPKYDEACAIHYSHMILESFIKNMENKEISVRFGNGRLTEPTRTILIMIKNILNIYYNCEVKYVNFEEYNEGRFVVNFD
jgi:hypothetical protein